MVVRVAPFWNRRRRRRRRWRCAYVNIPRRARTPGNCARRLMDGEMNVRQPPSRAIITITSDFGRPRIRFWTPNTLNASRRVSAPSRAAVFAEKTKNSSFRSSPAVVNARGPTPSFPLPTHHPTHASPAIVFRPP